MNVNRWIAGLSAMLFAGVFASAQETEHKLGEHPAVIVKRMAAHQPYDYVAQFYPHPAWLYLDSEPHHPMMDHPAVIVFKREHRHQLELLARTPKNIDGFASETH